MKDDEIISVLQGESRHRGATELGELLSTLLDDRLSQGSLISYFKRSFPEIPLRTVTEASAWSRVGGDLSDAEFNAMLKPWLPRAKS